MERKLDNSLEQQIVEKCILISAWNYRKSKMVEKADLPGVVRCNVVIQEELKLLRRLFLDQDCPKMVPEKKERRLKWIIDFLRG